MSEAEVTKSLANKIAGANLSDDETNLLISLIHDDQDEVEGFMDKASPKLAGFNIGMPPLIAPADGDKWIDVLSTDWGYDKPRN